MSSAPEYLKESATRSLLKAMSWRFIATLTTILIAWLIYGDIKPALAIGGIEFVAKFFVYYGHERLWQMVPRGTIRRAMHSSRHSASEDEESPSAAS